MLAIEYRQCLPCNSPLFFKLFIGQILSTLTPSMLEDQSSNTVIINHHRLLFPLSSSVTLLINISNSICSFRNITFTNQTNYLFYNTLILLSEAKHAERH